MSLVDEICEALDALTEAPDPLAEVSAVDQLDRLVRQARARVIRHAIAATGSYTAVARQLGMSRQRVAQAFPKARTGRP